MPVYRVDAPLLLKIPRFDKKLLYEFNIYVGSQWFCLSKSHVNYILKFVEDNPDFVQFFRHSFIPDEHFFQTIIMNSNLKDEIINDNLRHIVWSEDGCVPIIFSTNEAEFLKKSTKLFARKFDIKIDSNILDIIDNNIDSYEHVR